MHKETKIFIYIVVAGIVLLLVYGYSDSRGYQAGLLQGAAIKTVSSQVKKSAPKKTEKAQKMQALRAAAKKAAKESSLFKEVENKGNPIPDLKKTLDPFN